MDVFEAISTRRSVRRFTSEPVEREKIARMLEAARWAPSAGNMQTWEFIIVDDPEKKEKLTKLCEMQEHISKAPASIIILSDMDKAERHYGVRGKELYAIQETAICLQNMMLEAHNQGLGTTWVGSFNEDQIRNLFNIPQHMRTVAILSVGYPAETPRNPSKYRVSFVTYINEYGKRVNPIYDRFVWEGLSTYAKKFKNALKR